MTARTHQPCGTVAGYMRHRYHKEPACAACKAAWAAYYRRKRAEKESK